jgi:hypothetical protein
METLYTSDGLIYTGMSQETVQAMLTAQGSSATFVSKETFDQQTAARIAAKGN